MATRLSWRARLMARTLAFHASNRGSIPRRVTDNTKP